VSLIGVLVCGPVAVGQAVAPFSSIEISVAGVATASAEPFSTYWRPQPGAALRVETPFYLGSVFGALQVAHVPARGTATVPDYRSIFVSGGWTASIPLPWDVRLQPALVAGLYGMQFDDPEVPSSVANESEMAAGLAMRVTAPIGSAWRLGAAITGVRVFTRHPIDLVFVEFGITYVLPTPDWLRGVLE